MPVSFNSNMIRPIREQYVERPLVQTLLSDRLAAQELSKAPSSARLSDYRARIM